ncbi:M23 family metallopeptidase [Hyphomonas sp.]|uniref:M23 family metallopeptidase n=1 Tax=Hyphomonas sp. TaxID=87 RepID=UPI0025B8A6F4|nr:M23 family metallopeptidase [Hyphomonas sp.]
MMRDLLLMVVMCTGTCLAAPMAGAETAVTPMPATEETCDGALTQGGLVICHGAPGTVFTVAGRKLTAGKSGSAQFGIATDAPSVIGWSSDSGAYGDLPIEERHDEFRVIEGFDCDKVDARSEAQKAHAGRSWVKKQDAFATFHDGPGALTGFIKPADVPASSPFGPARKYIGVSKVTGEPCESVSVHRGYDMAAPVGTPIVAPAKGTVILADPDLYYEGGTVFLDHGHGLVSVFMHLSEVDVAAGDVVDRGDLLAKSGNTGRTTGPHLHWAVKWRNPEASDRGGDFYIDPALLLALPVTD